MSERAMQVARETVDHWLENTRPTDGVTTTYRDLMIEAVATALDQFAAEALDQTTAKEAEGEGR